MCGRELKQHFEIPVLWDILITALLFHNRKSLGFQNSKTLVVVAHLQTLKREDWGVISWDYVMQGYYQEWFLGWLVVLSVNVPRNRNSITFLRRECILSLAQGMGQSSLSWISKMLKLWWISLNLTFLKWDLGRRLVTYIVWIPDTACIMSYL